MKFHNSMLGMFFVYTLGLSMHIFKIKCLRRFLGKVPNFVYRPEININVLKEVHRRSNSFKTLVSQKIFASTGIRNNLLNFGSGKCCIHYITKNIVNVARQF